MLDEINIDIIYNDVLNMIINISNRCICKNDLNSTSIINYDGMNIREKNIEFSSINFIFLIATIENKYNIRIEAAEFRRLKTIEDVCKCIYRKLNN